MNNLKAENLTISIPNTGCDKNCPYCVSRMTGYIPYDWLQMLRKIEKVKTVARAAEITSVLFTGKGEPTFGESFTMLRTLIQKFKEFPLELQTNGIALNKNFHLLNVLCVDGLDVLAVSIDTDEMMNNYKGLFKEAKRLGMVSRVTVNVTGILGKFHPMWWINKCAELEINQLTFRRVTVPELNYSKKTADWIAKHAPNHIYSDLTESLNRAIKSDGRLIRNLKNGIQIWEVNDVAVATSDYCIQERDEGDNLRSLVFQEDGHLYTGWGSKASILF